MDQPKSICILHRRDGTIVPVIRPTFLKEIEGEYVIRCEVLSEIRREMVGVINDIAARRQLVLWPPEQADPWCWEAVGGYYRAIAELLTPGFDPGEIVADDRHRFFICTDPIEGVHGTRLGLSNMEILMGCQEPKEGDAPPDTSPEAMEKIEGIPSTGKRFLDILADATIFLQKKPIVDLCLALSPEEFLRLVERAATSLSRAHEEADRRAKGDKTEESPIREEVDISKIISGDFSSIKKENLPGWLQEEFE